MAVFYGKGGQMNKYPTDDEQMEYTPVEYGIFGKNGDADGFDARALLQKRELAAQRVITEREVADAEQTLREYKDGKANFDERIIKDELWWELRHWEAIGKNNGDLHRLETNSAWLFNTLLNKHADAMDNIPEPIVLPREQMDTESAKTLTEVLPVIMEHNDYENTYSKNWWEKLKHGTAPYSITWNKDKENGLGDIDISEIDLLNLYWQPGITDIQDSKNLFITALIDTELLKKMYPEQADAFNGDAIDVKEYIYDDSIDNSDKSVVVDWYYKRMNEDGRTILHYCKFAGGQVLYASENDPEYRDRGYYDHGLYPVVLDVMFPEKGTPAGFGYIAICKDPQIYIDKLSGNIMEHSLMSTKKRFFISNSTAINEDEFLDWSNPLVHVEGQLDDSRIREMGMNPLPGIYYQVLQGKIEEMHETSSNKDVNNGGTSHGVTAASAIAALQEAGNKTSRDMISSSYRAYQQIVSMVIELIRQFYDEGRSFRITGKMPDEYEFVALSNQQMQEQQLGFDSEGNPLYRKPVYDLKVKCQKKNPFSRMEENERAKELYAMGFFAPENAQAAMGALEMMDFEGIDDVREYVGQGQTLLQMVQQMSMQIQQMQMMLGMNPAMPANEPAPEGKKQGGKVDAPRDSRNGQIMEAQTPQSGYAQALAKRSSANMNITNNSAKPR